MTRAERDAGIAGLVGSKIYMLKVLGIEKNDLPGVFYRCLCDCGKEVVVRKFYLTKKPVPTKSCGCYRKLRKSNLRHGGKLNGKETPTYHSWRNMKARCYSKNDRYYPNYGGRGIRVCKEWVDSFENFIRDMGERTKNYTLDRIDVNGNYEPGNCKWSTMKEQNRNQTTTKLNMEKAEEIRVLKKNGMSAADIARRFNINRAYVSCVVTKRVWKDDQPPSA